MDEYNQDLILKFWLALLNKYDFLEYYVDSSELEEKYYLF